MLVCRRKRGFNYAFSDQPGIEGLERAGTMVPQGLNGRRCQNYNGSII
jgi:hypothetical protein